jgi:poly(A) polymerase
VAEFGRFARVATADGDTPDPVRRLAALTVLVDEDTDRLRERLRLSNDEHKRLARYAGLVGILKTWALPVDAATLRRLVAEHGTGAVFDAVTALVGEPRPVLKDDALPALERFASGADAVPALPLRGADLVAAGVEKGPRIGHLLELARQAWLANGCPTDEPSAKALLARILDLAASGVPSGDAGSRP